MEWRGEVSSAIQAFDEALGRPPFPQEAPADLQEKAQAVLETLTKLADAGKLKVLEGVAEATTTLPILCASLREGSAGRLPSLALYRPLILAAGLASPLSTYPISNLVADAKAILGSSLYIDAAGPASGAAAATTTAATPSDVEANEATLVTFMAATHSLTADDVRRFLRIPLLASASSHGKRDSKQKGGAKAMAFPGAGNKKTEGGSLTRVDVSRAVLDAMLDAPLPEDCRHVFETFFDNTLKFLEVVGRDGDLAARILAVYGGRIVPKLKPSSLLPCLNASLLDYFVDVVAGSLQGGTATLLVSKELREMALTMWSTDRVQELACAAASRRVGADAAEAMASLVVYTFLYLVACDLESRAKGAADVCEAEHSSSPSVLEKCEIDSNLLSAVCCAMQALLAVEKVKDKPKSSPARVSIQTKTGILVVHAGEVPAWLDALSTFVQQFLSRRAAASLLLASTPRGANDNGGAAATSAAVASEAMQAVENALCALLRTLTSAPPTPERSSAAPGATAASKKSGGGKGKGKQQGGDKTEAAVDPGKKVVEAKTFPPLALSELLSSCCSVFLLTSLLQRPTLHSHVDAAIASPTPARSDQLVALVLSAYAYVLLHQPQRLSSALWRNCTSLLTFSLWTKRAELSGDTAQAERGTSTAGGMLLFSAPLDQQVAVLRAATTSTDSALWLAPLVLTSDGVVPASLSASVTQLFSLDVELWLAVVQAAANAQNVTSSAFSSTFLCAQLFPAPAAVVLGSLCSLLDEMLLQRLADAVVTATSSRSTVMIASLASMLNAEWSTLPTIRSSFLSGLVLMAAPQDGLKRLLDIIGILEAGHRAVQQAAEADAKEAAQRVMQAQLAQAHQLAAAHRSFLAEAEAKNAAKAAEQQRVQTEAARRRAERAARLRDAAAARARKRQNALATLRERESQTQAQREAARRERFDAYQQRLQSAYRVSHFLEHLNLSSARVMATRDALRSVVDTITPDDLLEYLVSGVAKVPLDMLEDGEEVMLDVEAEAEAQPPVDRPRHTGQRRDFWAEILDHPEVVPVEESAAPSLAAAAAHDLSPPPLTTAATAAVPPPPPRPQSFHKRVSPLLDLFFYEDGDEFGKVPEVLPSLHLRLAASVWPPARTQPLGFPNLREAFEAMQRRDLVRISGSVVQLTLLGFRYHFPFHDPDGLLEVYLREARERVRAAVARRDGLEEYERSGEEDRDEGEEEEEWSAEEEEEAHDGSDADRLLPEVEFGI